MRAVGENEALVGRHGAKNTLAPPAPARFWSLGAPANATSADVRNPSARDNRASFTYALVRTYTEPLFWGVWIRLWIVPPAPYVIWLVIGPSSPLFPGSPAALKQLLLLPVITWFAVKTPERG